MTLTIQTTTTTQPARAVKQKILLSDSKYMITSRQQWERWKENLLKTDGCDKLMTPRQ